MRDLQPIDTAFYESELHLRRAHIHLKHEMRGMKAPNLTNCLRELYTATAALEQVTRDVHKALEDTNNVSK